MSIVYPCVVEIAAVGDRLPEFLPNTLIVLEFVLLIHHAIEPVAAFEHDRGDVAGRIKTRNTLRHNDMRFRIVLPIHHAEAAVPVFLACRCEIAQPVGPGIGQGPLSMCRDRKYKSRKANCGGHQRSVQFIHVDPPSFLS